MKFKLLKESFDKFLAENSSLPPGIQSSDIQTLDQFLKGETTSKEQSTEVKEDWDIFRDRIAKQQPFSKKSDEPYMHQSNIKDENGNILDKDVLKKKFSERPKEIVTQNSKLKKSGGDIETFFDISLPAYKGLYVDEKDNELKVVTVCAFAGACKLYCYARKGGYIQYPASSLRTTRILTFFMNDWQGFRDQVVKELKQKIASQAKKTKRVVLRWHDSGDFISQKYLGVAIEIAKATPEVTHYAYTKRVTMLQTASLPKNFIIKYSLGGLEDLKIDKEKHGHSEVVPKELFKDLLHHEKIGKEPVLVYNDENSIDELKKRLAKKYNIKPESILTYDEMMKTPPERTPGVEPKWNVIVKTGDGDDAATRTDVLGIYLLIH